MVAEISPMRYWRDLACLIVVLAAASWMLRPLPPSDNPVSVGERQYRANQSFQRQLEQELRTRAQDNVDRVVGPGSSITVNVDSSWLDREDKVIVAGEERATKRSGPEIRRISVAVVLRRQSMGQLSLFSIAGPDWGAPLATAVKRATPRLSPYT